MQLSVEISLYPLAEQQYKDEIWSFIHSLRKTDNLKVITNGMSTQVFGEYDLVMDTVNAEMKKVHQKLNTAVFICKYIAADRSHLLETHN